MMKVSVEMVFPFSRKYNADLSGNAIGLGSEPEELEVARNTVQIHALVENKLGELEYRKALEERICR